MSLLAWIVIGLIAGSLAQSVTGVEKRGCLFSLALGVAGALVGGALANAAAGQGLTGFSWWSFLVAFAGAVGLLLVLQAVAGQGPRRW